MVPVAHEVPPDHALQLLNGEALRVEAAVEELTLQPGPHTLTAGVVVAASAVVAHILADAISLNRHQVDAAGVLGTPVRVDNNSP